MHTCGCSVRDHVFYTYLWLREDGTPYYVGKGTGERAYRKSSPPREHILVQTWACESDAFFAEMFLISYYGRMDTCTGCLRNHTDGGEGPTGLKWSEASRAKARCRTYPPNVIEKFRKAKVGKHPTPETRARMSESHKGHSTSECTAEKIRLSKVGKTRSPETIQKMTGWKQSPEARLKMSIAKKEYYARRREAHIA
jgi:hypothetical protein